MVMATPTGNTCWRCGGQMMQSDARGGKDECENGCDFFGKILPFGRILPQSAIKVHREQYRCTAVGCGFTGSEGLLCPVCRNYSMVPNE